MSKPIRVGGDSTTLTRPQILFIANAAIFASTTHKAIDIGICHQCEECRNEFRQGTDELFENVLKGVTVDEGTFSPHTCPSCKDIGGTRYFAHAEFRHENKNTTEPRIWYEFEHLEICSNCIQFFSDNRVPDTDDINVE